MLDLNYEVLRLVLGFILIFINASSYDSNKGFDIQVFVLILLVLM